MAEIDALDAEGLLQDYTAKTNTLVGYAQNKLTATNSWQNIPGILVKVASSSAGWVWGYNSSNALYACKEPCTGGWQSIDTSSLNIASIQDIAVDETSMYLAYTPQGSSPAWATRPVDTTGSWSAYPSPIPFATIVATNSYLMGSTQAGDQASTCAKPCTTNGWTTNPQVNPIVMVGSDGANVYGTTPGVAGLKRRNEQGSTGWNPMTSVTFMPTAIAAESANKSVYAVDSKGVLQECTDTSCTQVDTLGYAVETTKGAISKNPVTQKVWLLTSGSGGTNGNIFEKVDSVNLAPVFREMDAEEQARDSLVNKLSNALDVQTNVLQAQSTSEQAMRAVQSLAPLAQSLDKANVSTETLRRQLALTSDQTSTIVDNLVPLQILTGTLVICVLIYITLGFILPTVMTNSLVLLLGATGLGAAIYFSVKGNAAGQRFIQSIFPTPS
jgi:hypothetical protein